MEPDHSANILNFANTFKEAKIISSAKAFNMMSQFFKSDFEGRKIYFSGDTEYSSALSYEVLKAANGKVDMVFVVINGKGGNMNWHEAVKLVAELKPRQAVPMHYGLFPANTENPNPFKKEVEKLSIKCVLSQAGKELDFS